PDAPAWVLVEDLGDSVVVTVRDEGPGIPPGRLDAARAEGRLGVAESVRGRIADLGGRSVLVTGPGQGTEWELTVPRA
ncbi:MAG TPA: ATP-binding protein, partial [Nocardioides sp.]|nr:ATP-binding protein [Nocardioides sp.]